MRPKDVRRAIESVAPTKRPIFLWGPPGVGKSDIVRQSAQLMGVEYLDVRLVYHEPGDLKFPIVENGTLRWVNSIFPKDPDWEGIIALEELPQCPPLVQAAAMQITLDRRLGEYLLPHNAMVVACGNRQEDRAGANRIITPLLNRFIHLDMDVSLEDWTEWAYDHEINTAIISLLQYKPSLLHQFAPERNEREFPTPRSWAFASDVLRSSPPDIRLALLNGCVGKGAAAELEGWLEIHEAMEKRYPIRRIVEDPSAVQVPPLSEGAILWALGGALAERARCRDRKVVQACMTYAMRMPLEFAVFAVRSIVKTGGSMSALTTPGAQEFVQKHKHIICAN